MQRPVFERCAFAAALVAALLFPAASAGGQANPYRGLWVGSVALKGVNEVSVPLDSTNNPVASDPRVPTATFDQADLRILVHVNGAGQASLLKDVAVLNRAYDAGGEASAEVVAKETDLALVTDPRTYASYPPQPATRIGSAAFDFGDAKTTDALDAVAEEAAQRATTFALDAGLDVETQAQRVVARNASVASMLPALQAIVANAAVAPSFAAFLDDELDSAALNAIAADPAAPLVGTLRTAAETLRDQSFYGDTRALDAVNAVVAAVEEAESGERQAVAHNTAAAFADVDNLYQRFISGKVFGDMVTAAADAAATAATVAGATVATIEAAMRVTPQATAAVAAALQTKIQFYDDTRAVDAIDEVLGAMAAAAFAHAAAAPAAIRLEAEQAGRAVLSDVVARHSVPTGAPTIDYNLFVGTVTYQDSASAAAAAASEAAIRERADNPLYTPTSVLGAARVAVANALDTAYGKAALAQRTELPLAGIFGPGSGDPRAIATLPDPSDLGPAGLEGLIILPASHPTNPFRHRRHPDHTRGFDIRRAVRFDFDGATGDPIESAGYGVDRITGTYREEIFGLHKALGPNPETQPVGLRTEGRFELNRISTIDTLNSR